MKLIQLLVRPFVSSTPAALTHTEWEYFLDESYYAAWAVRPKGESRWGVAFHVYNQPEAEELCRLLNEYKVKWND